jgi:hypothetical protein
MGSPLSPVLCNLYLEDLEKNAIATFNTKPLLFLGYVDDIFVICPENECALEDFKAHHKSHSTTTEFTAEKETNGSLPFLGH